VRSLAAGVPVAERSADSVVCCKAAERSAASVVLGIAAERSAESVVHERRWSGVRSLAAGVPVAERSADSVVQEKT